MTGSELNYKYRGGSKVNCKSLKHNESQNTINIKVLRPCEKRMKISHNEPSENTIKQDVTRDQSIAHFLSTKNLRICIADQFLRVFQCPPVHMWPRINKLIRRNLALPDSSQIIITRVVKTIESCLRNNKEIDITRDLREMKQTNAISLDSLEAQRIADYMETGLSF